MRRWKDRLSISYWPLLVIGLLATFLASGSRANAVKAGLAGPVVLQPDGIGDKIKEERDFATVILGNPWDLSDRDDIQPNGFLNQPGEGFANVSFADGVFSGVTLSNDSYLWLLHPGYPFANNVDPHTGLVHPIDASRYALLTFRLARDDANPNVPLRVYWYRPGDEVSGQPCGVSVALVPHAGWSIYTLNLADPASAAPGACPWQGTLTGLRLDPTATSDTTFTHKQIRLDWVRLTDPSSAQPYPITWNTGASDTRLVSLFADDDNSFANGVLTTIATNLPSQTTGSYTWNAKGLPPGPYYIHATTGSDYAGGVLNNPWDFQDSADYGRTDDLCNITLSSSLFRGTVCGGDAQIWLHVDANHPIDARVYHHLVVKLTATGVQPANWPAFMALWRRTGESSWNTSAPRYLSEGQQTIDIDLGTAGGVLEGSWAGQIDTFRIDPSTLGYGTFSIDWVGLTSGAAPTGEAQLQSELATSPGPLTINQAPLLAIVDPSMTSGADYATTILGKPWAFDDGSSVLRMDNLSSVAFGNGVMTGVTLPSSTGECPDFCGDPQVWLNVPPDPREFVKAGRFKYLTLRYWQEGVQDVAAGWALRILWSPTVFPANISVLDDVITFDGWPGYGVADGYHTYQFDLSRCVLEPGTPNAGWNDSLGRIAYFRIDPTEMPTAQTFHLKQVFLTADPVSSDAYTLTWDLQNEDDQATVTAYYTATGSSDRILIGSVRQPADHLVWQTANVPPGPHWIYLAADDGFDVTGRYSDVPVVVNPAPSIELETPDGEPEYLLHGSDFATNVLGQPWDMSSALDIDASPNRRRDLSDLTFANGVMSFTSEGEDPYFTLSSDQSRPIDTSRFKSLYVRMYASQATQMQVFWSDQAEGLHESGLQFTHPGWHVYRVDLGQYPAWSSQVRRVRVDPANAAGIQMAIDWIKLTDPTSAPYTVTWHTYHASDARVSLYISSTVPGIEMAPLALDLSPAPESSQVDLSWLEPGYYRVRAELDNQLNPVIHADSPGLLRIAAHPGASIDLNRQSLDLVVTAQHVRGVNHLTLDNTGDQGYAWSARSSLPWVTVAPGSGASMPVDLVVTAEPPVGIPAGIYTGTFAIDTSAGISRALPMTVGVYTRGSIDLPLLRRP